MNRESQASICRCLAVLMTVAPESVCRVVNFQKEREFLSAERVGGCAWRKNGRQTGGQADREPKGGVKQGDQLVDGERPRAKTNARVWNAN